MFARAWRVLGINLTGGEILRNMQGERFYEDSTYEDDDIGSRLKSSGEHNDMASGSVSVTINVPPHASRTSLGEEGLGHLSIPTLYVSEADVARAIPRVITHRLRVRNGPEDEIMGSVMFGAAFEPRSINRDGWDTRSTIKDILVAILGEV